MIFRFRHFCRDWRFGWLLFGVLVLGVSAYLRVRYAADYWGLDKEVLGL